MRAGHALAKGHLLEAVKRLRATMPMGLGEAKSVIEWHLRHNALQSVSTRPAATATAPKAHAVSHHPTLHHHPTAHAPFRPGGLSPGEVGKTSGGGMAIIVLLAIAAGLVIYFLQ